MKQYKAYFVDCRGEEQAIVFEASNDGDAERKTVLAAADLGIDWSHVERFVAGK